VCLADSHCRSSFRIGRGKLVDPTFSFVYVAGSQNALVGWRAIRLGRLLDSEVKSEYAHCKHCKQVLRYIKSRIVNYQMTFVERLDFCDFNLKYLLSPSVIV
jgi:hypothetical protein